MTNKEILETLRSARLSTGPRFDRLAEKLATASCADLAMALMKIAGVTISGSRVTAELVNRRDCDWPSLLILKLVRHAGHPDHGEAIVRAIVKSYSGDPSLRQSLRRSLTADHPLRASSVVSIFGLIPDVVINDPVAAVTRLKEYLLKGGDYPWGWTGFEHAPISADDNLFLVVETGIEFMKDDLWIRKVEARTLRSALRELVLASSTFACAPMMRPVVDLVYFACMRRSDLRIAPVLGVVVTAWTSSVSDSFGSFFVEYLSLLLEYDWPVRVSPEIQKVLEVLPSGPMGKGPAREAEGLVEQRRRKCKERD